MKFRKQKRFEEKLQEIALSHSVYIINLKGYLYREKKNISILKNFETIFRDMVDAFVGTLEFNVFRVV